MGKISGAILFTFVATIVITMVYGITDNSNLLFKLVSDPSSLTILQVLGWLGFSSAIGIAGTLIGVFVYKNDVFIFGVPFTVLIALAHPTFVSLFNAGKEMFPTLLVSGVVGALYLNYIWACIRWLRTGDA